MTRTIFINSDSSYAAKDGMQILIDPNAGYRYRMSEMMRWARKEGFDRKKLPCGESIRREWCFLAGRWAPKYHGIMISCKNVSTLVDAGVVHQHRSFEIFYKGFAAVDYIVCPSKTREDAFCTLVDAMLDNRLMDVLAGTVRKRHSFMPMDASTTMVLKAA